MQPRARAVTFGQVLHTPSHTLRATLLRYQHDRKEAVQAAQKGALAESAVPKVHLHATDESALKMLSLSDLKKYKADAEAPNDKRNRQDSYIDPKMSKDSHTANNHDSRGDQRGGHENGMRG